MHAGVYEKCVHRFDPFEPALWWMLFGCVCFGATVVLAMKVIQRAESSTCIVNAVWTELTSLSMSYHTFAALLG